MQKPSIAELLSASGYTTYTPELIQRAMSTLYGHVGANLDGRNWAAILQSANPLEAAEAALLAMYQNSAYLVSNIEHLAQKGYVPAQAELTYRQLAERVGFTHNNGWSVGTAYDGLSQKSTPQLLAEVPGVKLHGQESADLTIVAWGSTKGAVLEAVALAKADGLQVNFLQVLYASPFPAEQTAAILAKSKRILLVEGNKTAQLGALLRSQTGFVPTVMYLKYDSRPFTTVGILSRIKEAIAQ